MNFKNPYLSMGEKIDLLQRWILIHSIIYYELDDNIVSDVLFDYNSQHLMTYKKSHPEEYAKSKYHDVFKDFDGCTGFDLFRRLPTIHQHKYLDEAKHIIKIAKENK